MKTIVNPVKKNAKGYCIECWWDCSSKCGKQSTPCTNFW